jgi:hypothetical protein
VDLVLADLEKAETRIVAALLVSRRREVKRQVLVLAIGKSKDGCFDLLVEGDQGEKIRDVLGVGLWWFVVEKGAHEITIA